MHNHLEPEAWRQEAACKETDNPDMFFSKEPGALAAARRICAQCVVVDECLEYAFENNEIHGMWGGLSKSARQKVGRVARQAVRQQPPKE